MVAATTGSAPKAAEPHAERSVDTGDDACWLERTPV
jgi:hypothetical protein